MNSKKPKHYHVYFQQVLPAAISAALMGSGALGFIQAVQPLIAGYIPAWGLPAVEVIAGSLIAWWFGRK